MISIIADFSPYQQADCTPIYTQVPVAYSGNSVTVQIGQPLLQAYTLPTLAELGQHFCL